MDIYATYPEAENALAAILKTGDMEHLTGAIAEDGAIIDVPEGYAVIDAESGKFAEICSRYEG